MLDPAIRQRALQEIRENIARSGRHIYLVAADTHPRFAYTIGVRETMGFEIILAGAIFYLRNDVADIVIDIASQLKPRCDWESDEWESVSFDVAGRGSFTLRHVDSSWAKILMLGAYDYYQMNEIPAFQIVPDNVHWTVDVPNMRVPWNPGAEPVWRCLSTNLGHIQCPKLRLRPPIWRLCAESESPKLCGGRRVIGKSS